MNWTRFGQAEHHAQGFDQTGLGQPGNADQEDVAARQQRDQGFLDHALLAEDRPADLRAHPAEALDRGLDLVRIAVSSFIDYSSTRRTILPI